MFIVYCFSIDGHLCCFRLLAVVSNDAVNMSVQKSVQVPGVTSFGCSPRIGIAG